MKISKISFGTASTSTLIKQSEAANDPED